MLFQYPGDDGSVTDYNNFIAVAKENNVFVAAAADLMSLVLLTPPGEMGADAVVGTTQRFGVPMGFGGPQRHTLQPKRNLKDRFQVESLEYLLTAMETRPIEWPCKPESNTSEEKRQLLIFVLLKYYLV